MCLIGLLGSVLLSWRLWFGEREFPYAPLIGSIAGFSLPNNIFTFTALIGLIVLAAWPTDFSRYALIALCILFATLIAADQMRLQPWVYQYLFFILLFTLYEWSSPNLNRRCDTQSALQTAVAFMYIWAGINKFNHRFLFQTFPWLLSPFDLQMSPNGIAIVAIFAATCEMLVGVCFLYKKTRLWGCWGATVLHLIILLLIGPLGLNTNSVIWPWNVVMIGFNWILFSDPLATQKSVSIPLLSQPLRLLSIFAFGLMPLLGEIGFWDSYLSFHLYSGATRGAVISGRSINQLALQKLNVPLVPERRVYMQIFRTLCSKEGIGSRLNLIEYDRPSRWSGKRDHRNWSCSQIPYSL